MLSKICVNSASQGKFREEEINGRPHIITSMVSIVGDSVMNSLLYPDNEVVAAMPQLNRLLAPAKHPTAEGMGISAFDPLAINANNIGGFVLNPTADGKKIINELAIDIETAEKDERGKEVVRRIREGEQIGVSTGLNARIINTGGDLMGKPYKGIVTNIKFDHVAILLDETPAGDETYTVNSDVTVCNVADSVNELHEQMELAVSAKYSTDDSYAWVYDIWLKESKVIVSMRENGEREIFCIPYGYDSDDNIVFTGEPVKGRIKKVFEPDKTTLQNKKVDDMTPEALALAIIANKDSSFGPEDKATLEGMTETQLVNKLVDSIDKPVTIENAQKQVEAAGLVVKSKVDAEGIEDYLENKAGFDAYMTEKAAAKAEKVANIVANSKMSEEDVNGMSDEGIDRLAQSISSTANYSVKGASVTNASKGEVKLDFKM